MTEYQLPVLRRLTADEVVPGMTIAGHLWDTVRIGVAAELDCGHWCTASGEVIGESSNGYDLLVEAPKPPIKLPTEQGVVIRYLGPDGYEMAHRYGRGSNLSPWIVVSLGGPFSPLKGIHSDSDIAERMRHAKYELAVWTKPGDQ